MSARTTIVLPGELHRQAQAVARETRRTMSETVSDLVRRGLTMGRSAEMTTDPPTGLSVVSVGIVVASQDVRSLEDDE